MLCLVGGMGCGFEALRRMFAVRTEGRSFVVELALRMSMLMLLLLSRRPSFRRRPVRLGMRHTVVVVAGHSFGLAPRVGSGTSTPTIGIVVGAAAAVAVAAAVGFVSPTTA